MAAGSEPIDVLSAAILRALRGNSPSLSLDNVKISSLPASITRLKSLKSISARNNSLIDEGVESLELLHQLINLNLGGNNLTKLPTCLPHMTHLTSLYLFNNQIDHLNENIFEYLSELVTLNLNDNLINELPSSIRKLQKLKVLSLANNKLVHLPNEVCRLVNLTELHVEGNLIEKLIMSLSVTLYL
jgi:Leucine-rich repeat (LRR) protein